MRIANVFAALLAALAIGACAQSSRTDASRSGKSASADSTQKTRATTSDYQRYIRGSVHAFSSSSVSDWDAPDPGHVVVWISSAEAYLLTLSGVCFGLNSATTIFLKAEGGMVRAGGAAVMVGGERCPIQTVDRLDARAIKADGLH
jgi:hypothetical protein